MKSFAEIWDNLTGRARIGVALGAAAIVAGAIALGLWAYRSDYQVLFTDLAARDAAAMTAELDRMKTPYQLADGGNTILVSKDLVYKTRLKLMAKEVPLHGAVGFEVFNNADFGMTEFVQKVNYLRAVQGELTRTILAIDDIAAARVHLAIPEQGLFKKAVTKPKASVTLSMKQGRVLLPEQIAGIQRLVAASVPDIVSSDVTILDQHGVALTRVAQADGADGAGNQLDAKRAAEDYLVKKVTQVLDRTFGPGAAIATVDVQLNLDQSKVTTEEVLPARHGQAEARQSGVLVRERHSSNEAAGAASAAAARPPGATSAESEYQVGRRVEQLAVASGGVRRMTVAVLVKQSMSLAQADALKEVVALAIGVNQERGDAVVVSSIDQIVNANVLGATAGPSTAIASAPAAAPVERAAQGGRGFDTGSAVVWILCALLGVTGAFALLRASRKRPVAPEKKRLSDAERAQMIHDVKAWIATPRSGGGQ